MISKKVINDLEAFHKIDYGNSLITAVKKSKIGFYSY